MCKNIITIGRQCGSGGHTVGKELAERLGIPLYDKEIIEITAKKSGFDQKFIEEKEENRDPGMLKNFVRNFSYAGRAKYEDYQPLEDQIFFAQRDVILELAKEGPCVIVGRCADHILEQKHNSLNVFIHADMGFKIRHIIERSIERSHVSEEDAEAISRKKDKLRSGHYYYYTGKKWGDSPNYHLCLDSSEPGIERCVSIIEKLYLELNDT
ncbi:MAG: cytidylate kinase-like family protein [Clostridiales bacterium]|nr:cytidylate kinase-like family protein [Clostridiales bacterium]